MVYQFDRKFDLQVLRLFTNFIDLTIVLQFLKKFTCFITANFFKDVKYFKNVMNKLESKIKE